MKNYLAAVINEKGRAFVKLAEPFPDMPDWREFIETYQDQGGVQDLLEELQMTVEEFINGIQGDRQMFEFGRVLMGFMPLCGTTGDIQPFLQTLIQLHNESSEGQARGEILGVRYLDIDYQLLPENFRLIGRFAVNYSDSQERRDWNNSQGREAL